MERALHPGALAGGEDDGGEGGGGEGRHGGRAYHLFVAAIVIAGCHTPAGAASNGGSAGAGTFGGNAGAGTFGGNAGAGTFGGSAGDVMWLRRFGDGYAYATALGADALGDGYLAGQFRGTLTISPTQTLAVPPATMGDGMFLVKIPY
jgi:hypothetical protein